MTINMAYSDCGDDGMMVVMEATPAAVGLAVVTGVVKQ